MLMDHSRQAGVAEAISKTFDGAHPCPLCEVIREAQEGTDDLPAREAPRDERILAVLTAPKPLVAPSPRPWSYPHNHDVRPPGVSGRPVPPPPRPA